MAPQKHKAEPSPRPSKSTRQLPLKLSKREEDLLWHMGHGYQLETSTMGDNPILRQLKDNTEVRATANRSTIEALQKRGLIAIPRQGGILNPTVWRLAHRVK